jgi:hypothetical protein
MNKLMMLMLMQCKGNYASLTPRVLQTRLEKAQNKQVAFIVALSCMNECVSGFGRNLSPLRNF